MALRNNQDSNIVYDLTKPPVSEPLPPGTRQLTFGDLHGNALKLIYMLVTKGVVTLGDDPEKAKFHYEALEAMYHAEPHQQFANHFEAFRVVLKNLKIAPNTNPPLIRLIGDILADRGANDYLTLLVLAALKECGVPFEILFSNHDAAFLTQCVAGELKPPALDWIGPYDYYYNTLITGAGSPEVAAIRQDCSLQILGYHILRKQINIDDVNRLLKAAYYPSCKLLSYDYDQQNNTFKLFSHAPIRLLHIFDLADHLNIAYTADEQGKPVMTLTNIMTTIDALNAEFQTRLTNGTLPMEMITSGEKYSSYSPTLMGMLSLTVWNRDMDDFDNNTHPPVIEGVNMNYIFGHTPNYRADLPPLIGLDNRWGRPGCHATNDSNVRFIYDANTHSPQLDTSAEARISIASHSIASSPSSSSTSISATSIMWEQTSTTMARRASTKRRKLDTDTHKSDSADDTLAKKKRPRKR